MAASSDDQRRWRDAQLDPRPRVAEGRQLLDLGVSCAGDLSDGLIVDAGRTAQSSRCAAELWADRLPVDGSLEERFGHDWLELATAGGEDFELLAAIPEHSVASVTAAWPATLAGLTAVGRLTEGAGVRLLAGRGGVELPLPRVSSRHFW